MTSLHFQVIPTAFVVAYENDKGELVAVSEHGSASTTRQHHAARYFEPDAFA
jgi:hypothetical protein